MRNTEEDDEQFEKLFKGKLGDQILLNELEVGKYFVVDKFYGDWHKGEMFYFLGLMGNQIPTDYQSVSNSINIRTGENVTFAKTLWAEEYFPTDQELLDAIPYTA